MHENVTHHEALREVPAGLFGRTLNAMQPDVDMNKIAGSHDILFICLDTLRYDVAAEEEARYDAGTEPVWPLGEMPGSRQFHLSLPPRHVRRISALPL